MADALTNAGGAGRPGGPLMRRLSTQWWSAPSPERAPSTRPQAPSTSTKSASAHEKAAGSGTGAGKRSSPPCRTLSRAGTRQSIEVIKGQGFSAYLSTARERRERQLAKQSGDWRYRLNVLLDDPSSSAYAKVYSCTSMVVIAAAIVVLCLETLPEWSDDDDRVAQDLEIAFTAFFTLELIAQLASLSLIHI